MLGLDHFELIFKHENLDKLGFDGGCNQTNAVGYSTITLDTEVEDDHFSGNVMDFIKNTALHEMVHILTNRLEQCAYDRHVTKQAVYEANEELVNRLVSLLKR